MFLLGNVDPSVKYHSVMTYFLTSSAKTRRNSAWRAVLVGRYPWAYEVIRKPKPWRLIGVDRPEKNK